MLLFGFTQSSSKGWTSAGTLVPLAIAVLSFIGFVVLENGLPEPLIDMKLLASPALRTSLLIALFASVPASSSGFLIPQMLESHAGGGVSYGMGMSSFHAGLFGLFTGVVTMICGPLGGYLCRRYSPRLVVLTCSVIGVVASVVIALAHDHLWQYAISMMLFGVASGFYYAGTVNLVIEAVPPRLTGVSGGLQATTSALTSGAAPVLATVVLALYVVGCRLRLRREGLHLRLPRRRGVRRDRRRAEPVHAARPRAGDGRRGGDRLTHPRPAPSPPSRSDSRDGGEGCDPTDRPGTLGQHGRKALR